MLSWVENFGVYNLAWFLILVDVMVEIFINHIMLNKSDQMRKKTRKEEKRGQKMTMQYKYFGRHLRSTICQGKISSNSPT